MVNAECQSVDVKFTKEQVSLRLNIFCFRLPVFIVLSFLGEKTGEALSLCFHLQRVICHAPGEDDNQVSGLLTFFFFFKTVLLLSTRSGWLIKAYMSKTGASLMMWLYKVCSDCLCCCVLFLPAVHPFVH